MTILIGEGVIPVRAQDETAEGVARIKRNLDNLRATAKLDAEDEALRRKVAACQRELDRLGRMNPSPEVTARTEAAEARMRNLRAQGEQLDRMRISMRVEANTGAAQSNLRGVGREASSADGQVRRLSSSGRTLGSAFSSAARVPAILFAIAAGAGAAGAALGALPALAASVGGVGGVLVGSFSGVGEALKGYKTDQDAASASAGRGAIAAASNARAIRDAQQSISEARRNQARVAEDSARQVADAERNQARVAREGAEAIADASERVQDALEDERRAQEDVNDAFREATERLQDLRNEQDDYALDVEGASIRVARQEEELRKVMADGSATDLDRREAVNELAQSRERLEDVQIRQGRSAAELAQIERTGLAGTDEVVSAQGRLRDAQEATRDAQEQLSRTTRDAQEANQDAARQVQDAVRDGAQAQEYAAMRVAQALQGLDDAQAAQAESALAGAAASSKYAEAMAKLTPEGRAFVEQLLHMKPLVAGLAKTSQRSFLPGLTDMLRDSEGLFPIFDSHLERTGTVMGNTARKAGEMFKSREFKRDLQDMLESSLPITQALGDGLVSLTGRVIRFGAQMAPASKGFAQFITDTVAGFNGMLDELAPHAGDFQRIWEALGRIMRVVLPLLGDVVGILAEHLAPVLEDVAGWLERNNGSLDRWAFMILGAYLALKTLKGIGNMATWADGVMTSIGRIGGSAATADGKARGLHGRLSGLKALGKIGVTLVASYIGFELITGLMDGSNQGLQRLDTDRSGEVGTRERLRGLLSGDFNGIGNVMRDDIARNPNPLVMPRSPLLRPGEAGPNMNPFAMPEPPRALQEAWDRFFNDLGKRASKFATDNGLTWGQIKNNAITRASELAGGVGSWWGRTFSDSDSWFSRTRQTIGDKLSGARVTAVERAGSLWSGVTGWWGRTFGDSDSWFNRTRLSVGGHLSGARNWAVERAGSLWGGVTGWWSRTFGDSNSTFARLRDTVGGHMRDARTRAVEWAGNAWRGVTDWFRRMWSDLAGLGRSGVNGVIRALNWLSDKGNVVLRFLHVPLIPGIPMLEQGGALGPQMLAGGGRIGSGFMTNGPQAIVGEGRSAYPEFVIPTDPQFRSRALDLYGALGGQLMANGGQVPMLAEGGILGWLGDLGRSTWGGVTNFASGIGNKLGDIMSWVGDTAGSLGREALDAVRNMLPSEPWRGMGTGVAKGLFEGINKKINDSFMVSGDPGGSGVLRWTPLVLRALAMMGQPASLLGVVLRRMNQESGGNPTIFNNWDSNARKGTPSGGLMQTIWPTFRAYHFPGTSWNMLDPLANILASMRYAMARYGSLPAAYNRKGGYATGGVVPGTTYSDRIPILAQSGERVLSRAQNDAFERLIALLEGNSGLTGLRGEGDTIVNVTQTSGSPQETGRFVALGIRSAR